MSNVNIDALQELGWTPPEEFKASHGETDLWAALYKPYGFDLMVLSEQGHGFRGASWVYFREARYRYFQEHLKPQPEIFWYSRPGGPSAAAVLHCFTHARRC